MTDTDKESYIFAEQVRRLYAESFIGKIAGIINSLILALVLWDVASHSLIVVWVAAVVLIVTVRQFLEFRFNRSSALSLSASETVKYKNLFILTIVISGSIWGASGVVFFPSESVMHQAFIAFVLGGMAVGSMGIYSTNLVAFTAFSLPALLPLIIMFFRGQDKIHIAMGTMGLLFMILMFVTAKRLQKTLLKFLMLKFENTELVSDLREEISERKKVERQLLKSKEKIEIQVESRTAELRQSNEKLNVEIAEHEQTESALRENEEKYRDLVENINDVIFSLDVNGIITYISPALETVSGYTPAEVVGRSFAEYVYQEDLPLVLDRFKNVLSGRISPSEFRMLDKDGKIRWVRTSSRPVTRDGRLTGIRGILSDITENKNLEAQLQHALKMEAIGVLAGGVAHDLNNILSGVVSYPDLLLSDLPDDSPLKKPLQVIKKSGQLAADIVQDLLTLSRRGVMVQNSVQLDQVVSEYLESPEFSSLKADHPLIQVKTDISRDGMTITGSFTHLAKVVMNTVTNAVESMPAGGKLEITTFNRYVDASLTGYENVIEGDYAVLRVADTGIGISVQDQKRIYEPFYSKKAVGRSGTGLGMAVVWGTVKDHKGFIELQSGEGEGTCIDLFFPVSVETVDQPAEKAPFGSYTGKGESVLIIDDDPAQREIGADILSKLGYQVTTVAGGEEAVRLLKEKRVELLILDMIMEPGIDGLETYRRIIEIHPGQKAIIVSGFSETERVKEARRLGVGGYLRKPYTMEKLGVAVRRVLEGE